MPRNIANNEQERKAVKNQAPKAVRLLSPIKEATIIATKGGTTNERKNIRSVMRGVVERSGTIPDSIQAAPGDVYIGAKTETTIYQTSVAG